MNLPSNKNYANHNNYSNQVTLFLSSHTAQPPTNPKTNTNLLILKYKASTGMIIMVEIIAGYSIHIYSPDPWVVVFVCVVWSLRLIAILGVVLVLSDS